MLTVNPNKRITAGEALKHPWICVRTQLYYYYYSSCCPAFIGDEEVDDDDDNNDNFMFSNSTCVSSLLLSTTATRACGIGGAQTGDSRLPEEVQCPPETEGSHPDDHVGDTQFLKYDSALSLCAQLNSISPSISTTPLAVHLNCRLDRRRNVDIDARGRRWQWPGGHAYVDRFIMMMMNKKDSCGWIGIQGLLTNTFLW